MTVEALARAVLYEGYTLYPYRSSAPKNARRLLIGTLEASEEAEVRCLVVGEAPRIGATLRYLDLDSGREETFDGPGMFARGQVAIDVERRGDALHRVCARVVCTGEALGAAHFVLRAEGGEWVSQIDPPENLADEARLCRSRGLYPVLVGDAVLAAPIILGDHPALAPESHGDLFDATEIEEILVLRIQTLTEAEKAEIRAGGGRARAILERVEALEPGALEAMHGAWRDRLAPGARVRIKPKRRADALDLVLAGFAGTIVSREETIDGDALYCVTLDVDPGKDLGAHGFPGHRFFFGKDELERLP
ncbi:MAG TPA: hypothetical protein VM925_09125 [Labilithrix sp.]|nr:hypothetical protein [Labilithrix sp.]